MTLRSFWNISEYLIYDQQKEKNLRGTANSSPKIGENIIWSGTMTVIDQQQWIDQTKTAKHIMNKNILLPINIFQLRQSREFQTVQTLQSINLNGSAIRRKKTKKWRHDMRSWQSNPWYQGAPHMSHYIPIITPVDHLLGWIKLNPPCCFVHVGFCSLQADVPAAHNESLNMDARSTKRLKWLKRSGVQHLIILYNLVYYWMGHTISHTLTM